MISDPRCERLATLVEDLSHRVRSSIGTPGKTAEDFHDALEAIAIVAASLIIGSRSEEALDFFGRRLLAHVEQISREFPTPDTRLN